MLAVKKPLGFGGIEQVSEFLGIPKSEVREKAVSGQWPSYVIAGRRVFDLDELLSLVVAKAEGAGQ